MGNVYRTHNKRYKLAANAAHAALQIGLYRIAVRTQGDSSIAARSSNDVYVLKRQSGVGNKWVDCLDVHCHDSAIQEISDLTGQSWAHDKSLCSIYDQQAYSPVDVQDLAV